MPKGVDGSIGLDSLDFIELAIAIEERFGLVMDEAADLAPHFASFDTLVALHRLEDGRRVKSVAVTGLGVVSPFGAGVKTFWEGSAAAAAPSARSP